jgi:S-adenosylmethionine synthetase
LPAHTKPVFATEAIAPDARTRIQINPEGQVLEGGPALHAGLTGRKNGIDTYDGQFYRRLATYGQLGRTDLELPWETLDLANALQ